MTQIDYNRAAKYFLLQDFWQGMKLGLRYFFAPKTTLNYPHEKGPLSPRFRGEHALQALSERGRALHCLQALRGDLPGAGHHDRRRTARGRIAPDNTL